MIEDVGVTAPTLRDDGHYEVHIIIHKRILEGSDLSGVHTNMSRLLQHIGYYVSWGYMNFAVALIRAKKRIDACQLLNAEERKP